MNKWRAVTMLAVPACGALGIYLFSGMGHHEHHEQPAYSYMRRRLKQLPWGGDCALFEYGKCQEN
jgi:cytochrome c oxidase subunit 6a